MEAVFRGPAGAEQQGFGTDAVVVGTVWAAEEARGGWVGGWHVAMGRRTRYTCLWLRRVAHSLGGRGSSARGGWVGASTILAEKDGDGRGGQYICLDVPQRGRSRGKVEEGREEDSSGERGLTGLKGFERGADQQVAPQVTLQ